MVDNSPFWGKGERRVRGSNSISIYSNSTSTTTHKRNTILKIAFLRSRDNSKTLSSFQNVTVFFLTIFFSLISGHAIQQTMIYVQGVQL